MRIASSRARFLSLLLMTVQGASSVCVRWNIVTLAAVYSSHLSSSATSVGLSFHCRTGSIWRMAKRVCCSPGVTENHNFVSEMPSSTSSRSNRGTCSRKVSCSSSVQKPMTFSTPARLYQERSKKTISPAVGK